MNSKTVLSKIMTMLSLNDEVEMTYAKLADGTIVESKTFDVGEELFVVSEDGAKTPAPDGTHDLMLKDTEGNETMLKVISKDGKIVERENVELADEDAEMVKTEKLPSTGNEDPENVMADVPNSVTSGTQKMAEADVEVDPDMPETDGEPMDDEEMNLESLAKKLDEMGYRIEEMEKKMMDMMMPKEKMVDKDEEEKTTEMKQVDDEELPKLDGAPVEDPNALMKFEANRKNYGKKLSDPQNTFLSRLYN
jgi:DNA-directed RNA polymerase subunit H (RpoH/RPB5)